MEENSARRDTRRDINRALAILHLDNEPPQVKTIDYSKSLRKDEDQTVLVTVVEKNPSDYATLIINNTIIKIPLIKKLENGTALYQVKFNPSSISPREGTFRGKVVVEDKSGNKAEENITFSANLKEPVIKNFKIDKVSLGRYSVCARIEDENLVEANIQFPNGSRIPLRCENGSCCAQISTDRKLDFIIYAKDKHNLVSSQTTTIEVSPRDRFELSLPSSLDRELCLSLFDSSKLFREIWEKYPEEAIKIAEFASKNKSAIPKNLAYQVLDQIERDWVRNAHQVAIKAFELLDKLKTYSLNNSASLFIPGNFTSAIVNRKLQEDLDALSYLLKTDGLSPEKSQELLNFLPSYWRDEENTPVLFYTLGVDFKQSPYLIEWLKEKHSNPEFIQGLHRQHDYILYNFLGFNPANQTVRLIYVKPDYDYYFKFLFGRKIFVPEVRDYRKVCDASGKCEFKPMILARNVEIEFPLLPLNNRTKMKEWFPDREDRMIIYGSQYSALLTKYNPLTGEYRWPGSGDMPWSVDYGRKTLLTNLNLVWNGGKFGNFEGKIFDRITRAYIDPSLKTHERAAGTDYEHARCYWYYAEIDISGTYKDFKKTEEEFKAKYDPILSMDKIMDLGLRFTGGLTGFDHKDPHQYRTARYSLYSKALGYAGTEVLAKNPSHLFWHETIAGATPKYLVDILPPSRYAPGKMISRYAYGYDSSGRKLTLVAYLPTNQDIGF